MKGTVRRASLAGRKERDHRYIGLLETLSIVRYKIWPMLNERPDVDTLGREGRPGVFWELLNETKLMILCGT